MGTVLNSIARFGLFLTSHMSVGEHTTLLIQVSGRALQTIDLLIYKL
jgi:hypothetical protein